MTKAEVLQRLVNNEQQYDWVLAVVREKTTGYHHMIVVEETEDALNIAIKVLERELKHGEWIEREYCQVDEDAYEVATCSNCKAEITLEYPYDSFCPNCGARME